MVQVNLIEKTNSAWLVEKLIFCRLFYECVDQGVEDKTLDDHQYALSILHDAEEFELIKLPVHQASTVLRNLRRLQNAILQPIIAEGMECNRFALITFYALKQVIEEGWIVLEEGSLFDRAMELFIHPDSSLTARANIEAADKADQKRARKLVNFMKELGYFK